MLLLSGALPGLMAQSGPGPQSQGASGPIGGSSNTAKVYRDPQGVPHITAETETAAWYALGYEQARDGLLWIQYACKAAKGELTSVRGAGFLGGVTNDIAVKVVGTHLGSLTPAQLHAPFALSDPAIQANFWDNCVAYAAGANTYRERVLNAVPGSGTPERALHDWLFNNHFALGGPSSFAWVYNDPIEAVDIASQGGWTAAVWISFQFGGSVVNSIGDSYFVQGGEPQAEDPGLTIDPLDPDRYQDLLARPGGAIHGHGLLRRRSTSHRVERGASGFCRPRLLSGLSKEVPRHERLIRDSVSDVP